MGSQKIYVDEFYNNAQYQVVNAIVKVEYEFCEYQYHPIASFFYNNKQTFSELESIIAPILYFTGYFVYDENHKQKQIKSIVDNLEIGQDGSEAAYIQIYIEGICVHNWTLTRRINHFKAFGSETITSERFEELIQS
jgi:hypothetical protein